MTGVAAFNFPAFDEARDRGRSLGWDVISPADIDRAFGVSETSSRTEQEALESVQGFAARDLTVLFAHLDASKGDAIALLPGWSLASGAPAECFVARWLKLAILDARTFEPFTVGEIEPLGGLLENLKLSLVGASK